MATRQYIGARYVPKFYDFDGSPEWRSGVAYESLTIVTRNGNSYTSKIPVPSNIGAPENNPNYWVSTGVYNAQVESYRQLAEQTAIRVEEVATDTAQDISDEAEDRQSADSALGTRIDNEVTARTGADTSLGTRIDNEITARENADNTLKTSIEDLEDLIETVRKRKFIYICDSLGVGYSAEAQSGNYRGFEYYFEQLVGSDRVEWITPAGIGGGFIATPGHVWLESLQAHDFNGQDLNEFTDIVCLGGSNDLPHSVSDVKNAISAFVNYCKTTFPCATIRVITLTDATNAMNVNQRYSTCIEFGCEFVPDLSNLLVRPSDFDNTGGTHLSQAGYQRLAPWVNECTLFGRTYYHFTYNVVGNINDGNYSVSPTLNASGVVPRFRLDYYPHKITIKVNCEDPTTTNILYIQRANVWTAADTLYPSDHVTFFLVMAEHYRIPTTVAPDEFQTITCIDSNGKYKGYLKGAITPGTLEAPAALGATFILCGTSATNLYIILGDNYFEIPLVY